MKKPIKIAAAAFLAAVAGVNVLQSLTQSTEMDVLLCEIDADATTTMVGKVETLIRNNWTGIADLAKEEEYKSYISISDANYTYYCSGGYTEVHCDVPLGSLGTLHGFGKSGQVPLGSKR